MNESTRILLEKYQDGMISMQEFLTYLALEINSEPLAEIAKEIGKDADSRAQKFYQDLADSERF